MRVVALPSPWCFPVAETRVPSPSGAFLLLKIYAVQLNSNHLHFVLWKKRMVEITKGRKVDYAFAFVFSMLGKKNNTSSRISSKHFQAHRKILFFIWTSLGLFREPPCHHHGSDYISLLPRMCQEGGLATFYTGELQSHHCWNLQSSLSLL